MSGDIISAIRFAARMPISNASRQKVMSTGETTSPGLIERFNWLKNFGQWGIPGSSMVPCCTERVSILAHQYAGRQVLDIGTSRGRLAAILAAQGCIVTTVDQADRGASTNLMQMGVQTVVSDAADFLRRRRSIRDDCSRPSRSNSERSGSTTAAAAMRCPESDGLSFVQLGTLGRAHLDTRRLDCAGLRKDRRGADYMKVLLDSYTGHGCCRCVVCECCCSLRICRE